MNPKSFRCAECGIGTVRPLATPGRTMRHRTMLVSVPADLRIPTCDHCGAEWIDEEAALAIDQALEAEYRRLLLRMAGQSLETLTEHTSLRELEQLLGLSQGYLSKVRSGARNPSPELVGNLALLAADPKRRLRELHRLWESAAA